MGSITAKPTKAALYQVGKPLPSPIRVGRTGLPAEVKQQLLPFMRPDLPGFLFQWGLAWLTIFALMFAAHHVHSVLFSGLAIVLIATRQNVLGLLMHEQTHWLGSRSPWLDYFCELFVAYPLLVTLEGYRRVHLNHHVAFFTDNDPDYMRKQGKEWTFPQHMAYFLSILLRDITGLNLLKTLKSKSIPESAAVVPTQFYPPRWLKLLFFAALFTALTLTHTWTIFLLYWVLPLVTVFQGIVRWIAVTEHKYNLISPSVEEATPLIELAWWEQILFPNLNFSLHIYHHWLPNIPARHLSTTHQIFREAGLVDDNLVFHGYWDYFRFLSRFKVRLD